MTGYQLTFFTQQDRMQGSIPLGQWILNQAKALGIRGATLAAAIEGLGHDRVVHAVTMFDLSDQPLQLTLIVTPEECDRLLAHLRDAGIRVFYTRAPVEFGILNGDPASR